MQLRNKFFYVLFVLVLVLCVTELVLRFMGYQPGVFRQLEGFKKVDKLIVYKNFVTDEAGIYKFSKWVSDSLPKYYDPAWEQINNPEVEAALYPVDNLEMIIKSFKRITNPESFLSPLWQFRALLKKVYWQTDMLNTYSNLLKQHNDSTDEWAAAVKTYLHHPFNAEGFRSIEFKKHKTKRKRVLIIGDSFVYGMSAKPFYNSYYDVLLSKGYMAYAAGIPGTDPAQYAAIAEKYIPLLQPDLVMLCFFPGNDMMSFPRTSKPNQPHEHITNAGFFQSNIKGRYHNAEDAYKHYLSLITIPEDGTVLNTLLSKTAMGTLLWSALWKHQIICQPIANLETNQVADAATQIRVTKEYITAFKNTCSQNAVRSFTIVIPNVIPLFGNKSAQIQCDTLFTKPLFENQYYYPDSFDVNKHFPENDYHFNNSGHLLFANFLERLIQTSDSAAPAKVVDAK